MTVDSSPDWKRRRFTAFSPMDSDSAKARFAAAKEKYGHEIRVFETSAASATPSNASDIDKYLKTKKLRDAEEAARRSRMTKAVIRVRFPDNHTLEASFHPSETIQSLVDLLNKVVTHPEFPFYLYTTPPKKQIKDMSQDFYSAGFVPGAIVYFAYDVPKGDDGAQFAGPFLQEEVMSLLGMGSEKDLQIYLDFAIDIKEH
ncbi:Plant UBX domain-containing protein 1 [Sesamum angolense]|uniref:Plant UBX domain-containing protein 1 n=1 Tax=Sesamum angolense TaxID=2727404 RepID=A0AAE1WGL4_9LAMI|nr:Plant UBX domain-containing protein 1 [Sesamum angolense]